MLKFSLNLLDDLKPRAITRDLDWGVPVPLDGWRDRPDKKLYVWFDAVVGYLSASIEWAERTGDPDAWRPFWQDDRDAPAATTSWARTTSSSTPRSGRRCCSATPAIGARGGKPGSLGALDRPYEVVSSEFLTMEGKQFSSSRGVVIGLRDVLSRYDADALRYYLSRGRAGDPGHRLHLVGVPPPQQRRAGRQLGQPGQPVDLAGRPQLRRGAGGRRADRRRRERCWPPPRTRSARSAS